MTAYSLAALFLRLLLPWVFAGVLLAFAFGLIPRSVTR